MSFYSGFRLLLTVLACAASRFDSGQGKGLGLNPPASYHERYNKNVTKKGVFMFTGLKSIIYPSDDIQTDKAFWEKVSGVKPYFDKPFYVGFNINGSELGLDPNAASEGLTYPVGYWHVRNAREAADKLVAAGAKVHSDLRDVGEGMMMGVFEDTNGNIFGVIDGQKN